MDQDQLFTISEFAQLSGISRDNLIFYDRSGVLKPERVERNGYRYYSFRQLGTAYFLMTLKESGMALKQIKSVSTARTPKGMLRVFAEQKTVIQGEIERLHQRLLMIQAHEHLIREADGIKEREVEVKALASEPVYLGPVISNYHHDRIHDYYRDFFTRSVEDGIPPIFPLGCEISQESLRPGRPLAIHRIYSLLPQAQSTRPAGQYVIGYARGYNYINRRLYTRLMRYISENKLEISGNAYEEYMLDEISTTDPAKYLIRVAIPVRGDARQ